MKTLELLGILIETIACVLFIGAGVSGVCRDHKFLEAGSILFGILMGILAIVDFYRLMHEKENR